MGTLPGNSGNAGESFGKWRSQFWPIHAKELKKVLPLAFIFFLVSLNYNALRAYKDTIVVTAHHSGAEAIPFIKTWIVLPASILCTLVYTRLVNRFSREMVFYLILSFFLIFFIVFAFVFYPAQDYWHPNALANHLESILPIGCKGLIATFRNWTFTLFYVFSELWSTMIFTVLFWGFINEVTSVADAKRFYGFIMTGGNIAGVFSGQLAILFSTLFIPWLPYGKTAWDQSIFFLTCLVCFTGVLIMAIFRWLNVYVIRKEEANNNNPINTAKVKMSMRESFAYLLNSRYLLCITMIVLGYNIAMNLVEIVWKDQIKQLYPDPAAYNIFMGQVMTAMSITATIAGFFTTANIIRRNSWTLSAMLPPLIIGSTGLFFFLFVFMQDEHCLWAATFCGISPLFLSVMIGAVQNCLSRATKYTLFDVTKEIAFIPLDKESKLKGKAAIDGVGSRIGKSGGSVIHQSFIMMFCTIGASSHCIAIVFLGVVILWGLAVLSLGKQFDQLVTTKAKLNIPPDVQPALYSQKSLTVSISKTPTSADQHL